MPNRPSSLRDVFTLLERSHALDDAKAPEGPDVDAKTDPTEALRDFPSEGVAVLPGLISSGRAKELVSTIARLEALGMPAVFAYAFDAFWEPVSRLVPVVTELVGPCEVLADGWAWNIPPITGKAGWAPHRGIYDLVRQPDGRPGVVNVWVALSEVTLDTACMHVVPLSRDRGYPDALRREPFDAHHAKAYPLPAGSALFWDACSLHWGGPMGPNATHARTAYSFTVRAKGAQTLEDFETIPDIAFLSRIDRLDLIAEQILRYGSLDEVPVPFVEWASTLVGLRASRSGASKAR